MAGCARRVAPRGIHACLEVAPPLVGDLDLRMRDGSAVLAKDVKEDDQIAGSPVEHSVELSPNVAPKLPELTFDLRAMREGEMRVGGVQHVEPVNLVVEDRLPSCVQAVDEVADRLCTVGCTIVDRLEVRHDRIVTVVADTPLELSTTGG